MKLQIRAYKARLGRQPLMSNVERKKGHKSLFGFLVESRVLFSFVSCPC